MIYKDNPNFNIRVRIYFNNKDTAMYGDRIPMLFQLTDHYSSIHATSKEISQSYRKFSNIIKSAEMHLGEKSLLKKTSGFDGGGSYSTDFGEVLYFNLKCFKMMH